MSKKLFITNSTKKKEKSNIKRKKFIVYKIYDINKNKIFMNNVNNKYNRNIKFNVCDSKNTGKIKILNNNKLLFDNNIISEEYIKYKNQQKETYKYKRTVRNSIYRGLSKNGKKYQVLIRNNNINYYLGIFKSEKLAALIYDYFALLLHRRNALTNFNYSKEYINKIISTKINNE